MLSKYFALYFILICNNFVVTPLPIKRSPVFIGSSPGIGGDFSPIFLPPGSEVESPTLPLPPPYSGIFYFSPGSEVESPTLPLPPP
ncbi:8390_t:CDS:2 [Ambispora leptoticha]|uniref:8390_t:CDS:1 n=1 Tax=Ambispora leptoticha TaxID=144679 RepID=A0A9N9FAX2_9GLOM|nr:8390_t:CDS:2 [Ambispora leptoticha]